MAEDPLAGLDEDFLLYAQAFTKEPPGCLPFDRPNKSRIGFVPSFAKTGAKAIVLVARNSAQLQESTEVLTKEYPNTKFLPVTCDIKDEASVRAVFRQVKEAFGTADVLVNNAGTPDDVKPIRDANIDNFWHGVEVNIKGTFLMTQEFLNLVGTTKEATIVNLSSAMAFVPLPGQASYTLSKLAIAQLSAFIALENPNVRAVSVHPGTVMTDLLTPSLQKFAKDAPELVGGLSVWLTTKDAAFLNGRYITANWSVDELVRRQAEIVDGKKLGTIEETINPDALIPVTLLTTTEINTDLEGTLQLFATVDDVFQPDFGGILVEKPEKNKTIGFVQNPAPRSRALFSLQRPEVEAAAFEDLPSGPYFLHGPNLYQAWRLYDDFLDAFTFGVIPNSVNGTDDGYEALSSLSDNGSSKSIAVPSRLYHAAPSIRKPLSGVRISITDAASLKGVQTTLSSRSWSQLYGTEASETAEFVQKLIHMGAIIVGKTKSSQLDSGREWVDVSAPWNPRGDGYQDSGGSGAGAGASVGGYDWMENAIAKDSFEGVREQARVHGVYSIRASAQAASLQGLRNDSQNYAAVGLLNRHLHDLLTLAQLTLNTSNADMPFPKRIIYPLDFTSTTESDQARDDKFVAMLEHFLQVKADKMRLSDAWDAQPPKEANGQTLEEYMKEAPFSSFCSDFYHEYQDFRGDYKNKFGREPYVEATPRFRWGIGENETKQDYANHHERIEVFKKWFGDNIMSTLGDSETIMVVPFGPHTVQYRDDLPRPPTRIDGIGPEVLAPLLGLPHLVIPCELLLEHLGVISPIVVLPL
ncbi:hypothetical protein THAR02_08332 [Trichoderma harzianum]|uniref:Amidase domain-containing protein n=1 Tax=Trichoderma harzianum TaxID=5544 RepID=A0A0F9X314_TRIHA|nr:hypothetical protein THAR02_08332 [Trichoderma harzianum]